MLCRRAKRSQVMRPRQLHRPSHLRHNRSVSYRNCTLRSRVAPEPRNTRFRLVASLDRSGLSPAGSHRRFPSCLSVYKASPFSRLCLATIHTKLSFHPRAVPERLSLGSAGILARDPRRTALRDPRRLRMSLIRNQDQDSMYGQGLVVALELALAGTRGAMGALDEDFAQGLIAPLRSATAALAGAFVVPWTKTRPSRAVPGRGEHPQVRAQLGARRPPPVGFGGNRS